MADIEESAADFDYLPPEKSNRNAGAAWVVGLGLVRNDTTDPEKVIVNTTDGGRIDGLIPRGFEAQPDGGLGSMFQNGRYDMKIQDSETLAMMSALACNASGKGRLAILGDYVVAFSLAVVSGTGQTGKVQLLPRGSQYIDQVSSLPRPGWRQ